MGLWSLAGLASFFTNTLVRNMPSVENHMLEQAGQMVENEAKRVLGSYDYGFAPLAPSTIARKALGDSPGLETGEMRDSVHHYVTHHTGGGVVNVGSDLDKALWFELGTSRGQPARPWLRVAGELMAPFVADMCGAEMNTFLQGGTVSKQFGYAEHKAAWQARNP